jgi:hypothetical protein
MLRSNKDKTYCCKNFLKLFSFRETKQIIENNQQTCKAAEGKKSLTLEDGEFEDLRWRRTLGRRRGRIRRALGPGHDLELAVPERLLGRRLAVQQLGPRRPWQWGSGAIGGLVQNTDLLPKSFVGLEAHHCCLASPCLKRKLKPRLRRRQQQPSEALAGFFLA